MKMKTQSTLKIFPRIRRFVPIVLVVTLTLIARTTIPAQGVSTQIVISPASTVPMLAGSTQPVSNVSGNQTNPRINCNAVSYTFDDFQGSSTIHYFDLATGIDRIAPGNTLDLLSDIRGSRLAFTEVTGRTGNRSSYTIRSLTTAQLCRASIAFFRVLGGDILAFWDENFGNNQNDSEIGIYDLTTGAVTLLTNDALPDTFPAVSPSGDVIVWKKCEPDGTSCHIYSATRSSTGVFTTQVLTGGDRQ
jgi:hypothetical protein